MTCDCIRPLNCVHAQREAAEAAYRQREPDQTLSNIRAAEDAGAK